MGEPTALQLQVLDALRRSPAGKNTVWQMIRDGLLPNANPIRYGVALAACERRGEVESWYPSVESYGVPKVWQIKDAP